MDEEKEEKKEMKEQEEKVKEVDEKKDEEEQDEVKVKEQDKIFIPDFDKRAELRRLWPFSEPHAVT